MPKKKTLSQQNLFFIAKTHTRATTWPSRMVVRWSRGDPSGDASHRARPNTSTSSPRHRASRHIDIIILTIKSYRCIIAPINRMPRGKSGELENFCAMSMCISENFSVEMNSTTSEFFPTCRCAPRDSSSSLLPRENTAHLNVRIML